MADAELSNLIDKFLTAPGTLTDGEKTTMSGYLLRLASTDEAKAGTDAVKLMTPARTAEAITANAFFRQDIYSLDPAATGVNLQSVPTVGLDDGTYIQFFCDGVFDGTSTVSGIATYRLYASSNPDDGLRTIHPSDYDAGTNQKTWVLQFSSPQVSIYNNLNNGGLGTYAYGTAAVYDNVGALACFGIRVDGYGGTSSIISQSAGLDTLMLPGNSAGLFSTIYFAYTPNSTGQADVGYITGIADFLLYEVFNSVDFNTSGVDAFAASGTPPIYGWGAIHITGWIIVTANDTTDAGNTLYYNFLCDAGGGNFGIGQMALALPIDPGGQQHDILLPIDTIVTSGGFSPVFTLNVFTDSNPGTGSYNLKQTRLNFKRIS